MRADNPAEVGGIGMAIELDDAATGAAPGSTEGPAAVHHAGLVGGKKKKKGSNTDPDGDGDNDLVAADDPDEDGAGGVNRAKKATLIEQMGAIQLGEDGALPEWVHIFPEGTYRHPKGTLRFNDRFHKDVVDAVNSRVRTIDPAIDTDHDHKEANGWIKEARYQPGHGTDVRVEWTPLGEDRVRNKIYRYVSADFGPFQDPNLSSKRRAELALNAVSLTNFPYLKNLGGLDQVRLSEFEADPDTSPEGELWEPADNGATQLRDFSQGERDSMDAAEFGDPAHKKYPVKSQEDLKNAWDLAGRSKDVAPDTIRARLKRIAAKHGWKVPGEDNGAKPERSSQMSESTTTPAEPDATLATALNEATARVKALSDEVAARDARLAAAERQLTEMRIDTALRQLSEAAEVEVTGDDGAKARFPAVGLTASLMDDARQLILEHAALEEPLIGFLRKVREQSAMALHEIGVARTSDGHDIEPPVRRAGEATAATLDERREAEARRISLREYQTADPRDLDDEKKAKVYARAYTTIKN